MNNKVVEIAKLLNYESKKILIDRKELEQAINILYHDILFPVCCNDCRSSKKLLIVYSILLDNISTLLGSEKATEVVETFIQKLPDLQKKLHNEARNYVENDPAANSTEEVIVAYPGFFAIAVYRISHELHKLKVPVIPRVFSEYAHSSVGIDIHPAAEIDDMFYIYHGTGIVIGETCVIGKNVKIYQGVTLGALFVTRDAKDTKRHPTIEDNVVIYAGATILGGNTVVGHNSTIGGNVWLTHSVLPYSLVYHESKIKISDTRDYNEPIIYYI